jgi:hypothetical protein
MTEPRPASFDATSTTTTLDDNVFDFEYLLHPGTKFEHPRFDIRITSRDNVALRSEVDLQLLRPLL